LPEFDLKTAAANVLAGARRGFGRPDFLNRPPPPRQLPAQKAAKLKDNGTPAQARSGGDVCLSDLDGSLMQLRRLGAPDRDALSGARPHRTGIVAPVDEPHSHKERGPHARG
jgi:hypothetical protein